MQLALIGAIVTAIVGVVFALQNNVPVTVNFLLWRFDGSLAMALMIALALGALLVALLTTPATLKRQWQQSKQKRLIEELQQQLELQKIKLSELDVRSDSHPSAARPANSPPTPEVGESRTPPPPT